VNIIIHDVLNLSRSDVDITKGEIMYVDIHTWMTFSLALGTHRESSQERERGRDREIAREEEKARERERERARARARNGKRGRESALYMCVWGGVLRQRTQLLRPIYMYEYVWFMIHM